MLIDAGIDRRSSIERLARSMAQSASLLFLFLFFHQVNILVLGLIQVYLFRIVKFSKLIQFLILRSFGFRFFNITL